MTAAVHGFAGEGDASVRLARELGIDHHEVEVRHFPDGESLVRAAPPASSTALLFRSLDRPNAKLVEILLAASALRDCGAARVILIAPYLCYMRQDIAFHPGEAVSQRVVGRLLAGHFDGLMTIDPHLHRIASLDDVVPGIESVNVSAGPLLATAIDASSGSLLVGPDGESAQWVEQLAQARGLEFLLGRKQRKGDREVALAIPGSERVSGRPIVIVDDVISSGTTIIAAARQLRSAGASSIDVLATHCLAGREDLAQLREEGIRSVRATDSVAGPAAVLFTAGLLAKEIRRRDWHR